MNNYKGLWGDDYNPILEVYESRVWMMKNIAKDLGRQYVDEMVEWGTMLCSIANSIYDVDVYDKIRQSMNDKKERKWVENIYSQLNLRDKNNISNTFFQEAENRVEEITLEMGWVLQDGFWDDKEFFERLYAGVEEVAYMWAEKQFDVVGGESGDVLEDAKYFSSDWENVCDLMDDEKLRMEFIMRYNYKLCDKMSNFFYDSVSNYLDKRVFAPRVGGIILPSL